MQEVAAICKTTASTQPKLIPNAYQQMVTYWQTLKYGEAAIDYDNYALNNTAFANMFDAGPCVTWILDLRHLKFAYISSNTQTILGYDQALFYTFGLDFKNQAMHPEDLPKTWGLIKKIWDLLLLQPVGKRLQYTFTHDYRLIKPNGTVVRLLEQCSILQQDSKGNITHIMGICSDITSLKKHDTLSASVLCRGEESILILNPNAGNLSPQVVLSKRELEIIKLISAGYSSKLIADKLCIGFSTVNTHRQNIIRKTNTRNTGEVVQFAMGNGLI